MLSAVEENHENLEATLLEGPGGGLLSRPLMRPRDYLSCVDWKEGRIRGASILVRRAKPESKSEVSRLEEVLVSLIM